MVFQIINDLNAKFNEVQEENKLLREQIEMTKINGTIDKSSISNLQKTIETLQSILQSRLDQEG